MFSEEIKEAMKWSPASEDGFVRIGVLSHILGRQSQYVARHFSEYGVDGPCFDEGLRVKMSPTFNYHDIQIHEDDLEVFLTRYFEVYPRS